MGINEKAKKIAMKISALINQAVREEGVQPSEIVDAMTVNILHFVNIFAGADKEAYLEDFCKHLKDNKFLFLNKNEEDTRV